MCINSQLWVGYDSSVITKNIPFSGEMYKTYAYAFSDWTVFRRTSHWWEKVKPMKFNVGDKVRCINGPESAGHGYGWELGLEFTVTETIDPESPYYFGGKGGNGVYEPWLALVPVQPSNIEADAQEEASFNVGDRITGTSSACPHLDGQEATITEVSTDGADFKNDKGESCWEPFTHMEHITSAPKKEEPMAFNVNDIVRITGLDGDVEGYFEKGTTHTVTDYDTSDNTVYLDDEWWYPMSSVEKVTNNEKETNMSKYFKVIKETPELVEDAVLQQYSGEEYIPISSLWNQDGVEHEVRVKEPAGKPEYFKQVWASEVDGRTVYVDKDVARQLLNDSVTVTVAKKASK